MDKLNFDYSKLIGRIIEKCGSQKAFAKKMNMSETSLSLKLNCKNYFTQSMILKAMDILEIEPGKAKEYFFTVKV